MNNDFVKKVALYKELFDAKTISEEQYLNFIKEVVNEQTKEVVENKDLSFEAKREELVNETRQKSQDLRDRLNEYERKGAEEERKRLRDKEQESEVSFAIQFLSQIYDSYGNRVYPDELLEDETKMSLYEMQSLIENIKNSAPQRYNEIVSKIDPSKVIEINEEKPVTEQTETSNNVEEPTKEEAKETTTGLPEGYSDFIVNNTTGEDLSAYVPEINQEANTNAEPQDVAIEQPKPTTIVDLTNDDKAKNDLEEYMAKNGVTDEDKENTSELTREEAPKRPKLITRAKDALMSKINSKNGKINANLAKMLLVVGGVALGAITLGASGLVTAAAIGAGGAIVTGAAAEYIKKVK